ncbi:MAG: TolB-like 6-bladed beta-propeller domain-containing protein [Clostridium sp.]|nr:TolB-like 6-bladed beta-propeller domain-containing protein [Clostridium sp.]
MIVIANVMMATGCVNNHDIEKQFCEFPVSITLEGERIYMPDSVIRVLGMADVVDSGYVYFLYDSPFALSASDTEFKNFTEFARKGQGPGEVAGVSAMFSTKSSGDGFTVYDPYRMKLYGTSFGSGFVLNELSAFPDDYIKYSPSQVFCIGDGTYVGARGDFNYGLVAYNPAASTVAEWPLGDDFDTVDPVYEEVATRSIGYNRKNGVVGEIYGAYPVVILHDETGRIVGRYRYTGYAAHTAPDNQPADCFMDLELTDSYIWILYGDQDESESSKILVLDYAGEPIAELVIESTSSLAVDEKNRKILSIDPNNDDGNLTVYNFPEILN